MSFIILFVSFCGWLLVVVLFFGLVTKRIEYSVDLGLGVNPSVL